MKANESRFSRNLGFISEAEQQRLIDSTVAVAGAGGDGGALALQLARLGVGKIKLADPDVFEEENINRQVRATEKTVGHNKAEVIAEYISDINSDIEVEVFSEGITTDNAPEFVEGVDLLIDETEFTLHAIGVALARQARLREIPNLMAMNIGFGTTVTTFKPDGRTLEKTLGLSETSPIDEIAQQSVSLSKWLPYVPSYGDIDVFKTVAAGKKSAPSIAPGVAIASAVGASQAFLNLVNGMGNNRQDPIYAPDVMVMDAMTGESKVVKQSSLSHNYHLAKMVGRNLAKKSPKASYSDLNNTNNDVVSNKMNRNSAAHEINPEHIELLRSSLQAPSAHNAQPWLIRPLSDGESYELHYDQSEDLPEDPDDKDAYLTMGALVETMTLQAPNFNLGIEFDPIFERYGRDLFIGTVAIKGAAGDQSDPLSSIIGKRHTNREKYTREPLPAGLEERLKSLGNTIVEPKSLKEVVESASIDLWRSQRYIHDLKAWFRENDSAEDGITPAPFSLSKSDVLALKFAFKNGAFKSKLMGYMYSQRDVSLFTSSPAAGVMTAPEMTPPALFDAGRRLLRSWTAINGEGYSYQPYSVAVDNKQSAAEVARISGVDETPVALYRIGQAIRAAKGRSGRKPLEKVLITG